MTTWPNQPNPSYIYSWFDTEKTYYYPGNPSQGQIPDAKVVALHELGHWLSLGHEWSNGKHTDSVMFYDRQQLKYSLTRDDNDGVPYYYDSVSREQFHDQPSTWASRGWTLVQTGGTIANHGNTAKFLYNSSSGLVSMERNFGCQTSRSFQTLFYDDGTSPKGVGWGVRDRDCDLYGTGDSRCEGLMVGIKTDAYANTYFWRYSWGGGPITFNSCGVGRSAGWHRFTIRQLSGSGAQAYVDGYLCTGWYSGMTSLGTTGMYATWNLFPGGGSNAWFDNVLIR